MGQILEMAEGIGIKYVHLWYECTASDRIETKKDIILGITIITILNYEE